MTETTTTAPDGTVPTAASPEGLWLAVRTSEHARAARRARQELGRVSTLLGYERDRTERLRGTITAQRNRIWELIAGHTRTLHVAALRLADRWEAEAGLVRAGLPASGEFDSAQCYADGATEAYIDVAKQLRELVGRPDDDVVDACIHTEDWPGGECRCDGAQAERDAQLVAKAEQLGDEISPDRPALVEAAATVLVAHYYWPSRRGCQCGWLLPPGLLADELRDVMCRHVAEQLAAAGVIAAHGTLAVLIDVDGDEWLPRPDGSYYCPTEDIPRGSRAEVENDYGPVTEKAGS